MINSDNFQDNGNNMIKKSVKNKQKILDVPE